MASPLDPADDPSAQQDVSPESFLVRGDALRARCRAASAGAFAAEHPYLWLVRELRAAPGGDVSFATAFVPEGALRPGGEGLLQRVAQAPADFGFFPLRKTDKNPWKDKLLVGRATNNDVVVRDASVSKVHARITQREGAWTLSDARSTNGTWVDGVQLPAGGAAPLRAGGTVKLGGVSCSVLDSEAVHRALAGGAP